MAKIKNKIKNRIEKRVKKKKKKIQLQQNNKIQKNNKNISPAKIKVVGVGAGFSYSLYGATHQGVEDMALMRALPNMTVTAPGDPVEVWEVTKASVRYKGPMYIRLGKAGEPVVHTKGIKDFRIGKTVQVFSGKDATIFVTSNMLETAFKAVEELRKQGIDCRLVSVPTIKPMDRGAVVRAAKQTRAIITVEEHNIIGGLGSAVAEVLAESGLRVKFKRLGVPDCYPKVLGSQVFIREKLGIGTAQIIRTVKNMIG